MTIVALLILSIGIFLAVDGANSRGLVARAVAGAGPAAVFGWRLGEVLVAGAIFIIVGALFSAAR